MTTQRNPQVGHLFCNVNQTLKSILDVSLSIPILTTLIRLILGDCLPRYAQESSHEEGQCYLTSDCVL